MSSNINILDLSSQCFQYFGWTPKLDNIASILYHRPVLDIFGFDVFLHSKYGEYEEHGKSMSDVILENYGEKAVAFCKIAFLIF